MFFGPPSALFGSPPAADNLWRGRRRGGGGRVFTSQRKTRLKIRIISEKKK
jgi:hypothetical protein